MNSCDHNVGGSCGIGCEFPSLQDTIRSSLVGDILFLLCHITSRDFVVRESRGIMGEFQTSCKNVFRGSYDVMGEFPSS